MVTALTQVFFFIFFFFIFMLCSHSSKKKSPEDLLKEIKKTREMTDKPFGVNFTIIPALKQFDFDGFLFFFLSLLFFLSYFHFPVMHKLSWTEESTSSVQIPPLISSLPSPSHLLPSETAGSPQCAEYWEKFKKHDPNTVILHKCVSTRHALKAEKLGCDFISLDGFEWFVGW